MNVSAASSGWTCPAVSAFDLITGKWRAMILFWLLKEPLRFNELQRRLGAVTHRTLSRTLKDMEADGLVTRHDHGEIPPRVDYALTPLGQSLREPVMALGQWAADNQVEIEAARGQFDAEIKD